MRRRVIVLTIMLLSALGLCWGSYQIPSVHASPSSSPDDWPMFHHNANHTGYSTTTAPNSSYLLWTYTTGGSIHTSSPTIADGRVFIGSRDYKVYCLNASTGAEI
ncbi:MAG: PQQ-binding-like beta-propeller repeat protein, partial [Candidatus Bathyarchaeia archaeon]